VVKHSSGSGNSKCSFCCGAGSNMADEEYISTYHCPEPVTDGTVLLASMSGFCTPESIIQATTDLRYVLY